MFAYEEDKNKKYYRKGRILFALFAAIFGGLVCGLYSLYFATADYNIEMYRTYFQNIYIVALNLLPPMLLALIFYLLTNRAWASYILTNIAVIVPSLINYYKIAFRGDCFIAEDITLASEAGAMLKSYRLFIDNRIAIYIDVLVIGTVMLGFFAKGRFRKKRWHLFAALLLATASAFLVPVYTSGKVYDAKTANNSLINEWSDTQKYISKGFVYPFLHSVKDAIDFPPEGYSEKEAEEILNAYTSEVIKDDKKVNLVCVMLEAYNDLSLLDELEFEQDVYAKYHELEALGYSGTLITDIFAGDTRISEREFLTGMPFPRIDSFSAKSNSYVWYLKQNGYVTEGSHPCFSWFYNREHVNKNLGFDNYYFTENYFKAKSGGDITWDSAYFPLLLEMYQNRDKSKPYFNFSITYQGHGPYDTASASSYDEANPYVKSTSLCDYDRHVINNYLGTVKSTTEHLYTFATEMLKTEEPLVLVFFGDHKPWLGNNGSVYDALGISTDLSTDEGFFNYYSTRYLILANDAAKKTTGNDFLGEGETISVSFLMNKVFELCGYKGSSYMQFTSDIMEETPVIHRLDIEKDGTASLYDKVSYYYRKVFAY